MKELFSIKQKKFLCGTRELTITSDKEIVAKEKNGLEYGERTFSIFDLDDKFQVVSQTSWFPLLLTICCIGLSGIFIFAYSNTKDPLELIWITPWAIGAIISFIYFIKGNVKFLVVRFYGNEDMAFQIWLNNPNKEEYEKFTNNLREIIKNTKVNPKLTPSEKAQIYIDQIIFLTNEGVFPEDEANQIIDRIVKKAKTD